MAHRERHVVDNTLVAHKGMVDDEVIDAQRLGPGDGFWRSGKMLSTIRPTMPWTRRSS